MIKTQADVTVKELCTDGGKEFHNKDVQKFAGSIGLKHSVTAPYTPQQNGIVEQENRILDVKFSCKPLQKALISTKKSKRVVEISAIDKNADILETEHDVGFEEDSMNQDVAKIDESLNSQSYDTEEEVGSNLEARNEERGSHNLCERRNFKKPSCYCEDSVHQPRMMFLCETPRSYKEALQSENSEEWTNVMEEDMDALKKNGTWELVFKIKPNNMIRN
ncbi:uncharacterized protein LOC124775843 [Schistocerca piceifrons]|uniref:uncharacterized protein LOC124775843 n=1 Tax=Schistocerca piceifrons TaxID=274613 RepID=UPI001F5E9BB5|nr:uncharacterized protein LOC124775843 [Schistocerca piceifrons]